MSEVCEVCAEEVSEFECLSCRKQLCKECFKRHDEAIVEDGVCDEW